jgi:hypothetical protein
MSLHTWHPRLTEESDSRRQLEVQSRPLAVLNKRPDSPYNPSNSSLPASIADLRTAASLEVGPTQFPPLHLKMPQSISSPQRLASSTRFPCASAGDIVLPVGGKILETVKLQVTALPSLSLDLNKVVPDDGSATCTHGTSRPLSGVGVLPKN